jgi:hypothetical protein
MYFWMPRGEEVISMTKIHGLELSLIFMVLIVGGCAAPSAPSPIPAPAQTVEITKLTRTKSIVKTEIEGVVLHYQNESYWEGGQYSAILRNKAKFSSDLIAKFVEDVSTRGEKCEEVANAYVEFNEGKKSTILTCNIHGAISRTGNSYHATFFWLLRPLGLDFIDDHFDESKSGLFWQGSVNGIPTTITVELPAIGGFVYKAWEHPIGHCHAHVWWELAP